MEADRSHGGGRILSLVNFTKFQIGRVSPLLLEIAAISHLDNQPATHLPSAVFHSPANPLQLVRNQFGLTSLFRPRSLLPTVPPFRGRVRQSISLAIADHTSPLFAHIRSHSVTLGLTSSRIPPNDFRSSIVPEEILKRFQFKEMVRILSILILFPSNLLHSCIVIFVSFCVESCSKRLEKSVNRTGDGNTAVFIESDQKIRIVAYVSQVSLVEQNITS